MAAPTRTPRSSWIDEGLRALGVGGPDAVRIENLAQALGVTKGGFYWHFGGPRALVDERLDPRGGGGGGGAASAARRDARHVGARRDRRGDQDDRGRRGRRQGQAAAPVRARRLERRDA